MIIFSQLRSGALLGALLALSSLGVADIIPSTGTVKLSKPSRLNTNAIRPQIVPRNAPIPPFRAENPEVPINLATGEPNNLPLGRLMEKPRISLDRSAQFPGLDQRGATPPDPDIAISATHAVAVVNVDIGFYALPNGTQQFRQPFTTFFQGVAQAGFIFDPKAFFDPQSRRFFVVALELNDDGTAANNRSATLVAVSDDADPRGNWNRYRIDSRATINSVDTWLDYPGFGFSRDRVVLSGNQFGFGTTGGYQGTQLISIPKADLLAGGTPTATKFVVTDSTVQWAQTPLDANEATNYGISLISTSAASLFSLTGSPQNPTLTRTTLTIPNFSFGTGVVGGPGGQVDALEFRFLNAMFVNGSLVTAHSVPTGSGGLYAARWYEVRTNGWPTSPNLPTLRQSGEVTSPGLSIFMPAVGLNRVGDIVMSASRRGTGTPADHILTGRRATDPLGAMGRTTVAFRSAGNNYIQFRWGDYFGVQVDPSNQRDFWGVAMTLKNDSSWSTNIAKIRVSVADTGVIFNALTANPLPSQGNYAAGSTSGLAAAGDGATYTVNSVSVAQGHVASVEAGFRITGYPNSTIESIAIPVVATAPSEVTGQLFAYNWNTSKYDLLTQSPFGLTGQNLIFELTAFARYIKADTGDVRIVLRSVRPKRTGKPYALRVDRLQVVLTPRE